MSADLGGGVGAQEANGTKSGAPLQVLVTPRRQRPNILITGTPGTGKSCTCELLQELTSCKYTNVGEVIRVHEFHAGKDEEFDTFILDEDSEDRLLDHLEPIMVRRVGAAIGVFGIAQCGKH